MERGREVNSLKTGQPAGAAGSARPACGIPLRVGDIMSTEVVTAAPEDRIATIAQMMSERNVSCVVILYQERVVGILTAKDMLNIAASRGTALYQAGAAEQMSSPVDTVATDLSILEADQMMATNCIRRLPVVEGGRLAGIVTQTDITRALISLNSPACVADVMTRRVATTTSAATVMEAARAMSCAGLSCLAVTHEDKIAGIITEKDLLKRVVALQKDPAQTCVMDVMSLPVVTIPSQCSILDASKKMEVMHLHRLLVTDHKAICGVITQTDIMRALRRSAEAAESQHLALEGDLGALVQRAILDLQRVREFLGGIPYLPMRTSPSATVDPPTLEETVSSIGASEDS